MSSESEKSNTDRGMIFNKWPCSSCRRAHAKCDRFLTGCTTCVTKGRECVYDRSEPTSKPPRVINNRTVKNKTQRRSRKEIEAQGKREIAKPKAKTRTKEQQSQTQQDEERVTSSSGIDSTNTGDQTALDSMLSLLPEDTKPQPETHVAPSPAYIDPQVSISARTMSEIQSTQSLVSWLKQLEQQSQVPFCQSYGRAAPFTHYRRISIQPPPPAATQHQGPSPLNPVSINIGLVDQLHGFYTEYAVLASLYVHPDRFRTWIRALLVYEAAMEQRRMKPQPGLCQIQLHYREEIIHDPITELRRTPLAEDDMALLYMNLALVLHGFGLPQLAAWYLHLGERMIDRIWQSDPSRRISSSPSQLSSASSASASSAASGSSTSSSSSIDNSSASLTQSIQLSTTVAFHGVVSDAKRKETQQCVFALLLASFYHLAEDELGLAKYKVHRALCFLRSIGALIDTPALMAGFDLFHRHLFIDRIYDATNPRQQIAVYERFLQRGFASTLLTKLPASLESADPLSEPDFLQPTPRPHQGRTYLSFAAMQISTSEETFISQENLESSIKAHKLAYSIRLEEMRLKDVFQSETTRVNAIILLKGFELRGCMHMLQQASCYHESQGSTLPDSHREIIFRYAVATANDVMANVRTLGVHNLFYSHSHAISDAAFIHCQLAGILKVLPQEITDALRLEYHALQSMASRFRMVENRFSSITQRLSAILATI